MTTANAPTEPPEAPDFGPFTPTHRLRYERPTDRQLIQVLVQENNGDLYTEAEWDLAVQPDWRIHAESGDPMFGGYFARDCFRRVSLRAVGEDGL